MISLLVAMGQNNVIGYENDMPWYLPKDLQYFKEKTTGKTIIMGRKTFESIGRPLPNRTNIVLTRKENDFPEEVKVIHHINEIKQIAEDNPTEELFVIGGGHVYEQVLPFADRLYVTEIKESFQGDTYFPTFSKSDWDLTKQIQGEKDENNPYDYYFLQFDRKK